MTQPKEIRRDMRRIVGRISPSAIAFLLASLGLACRAKPLSLIPDYTRAINGLANIYFFTLEAYENALKTYEAALKWDPQNTAALFGRGAALHNLDRFEDSNKVLDLMLASGLSRNGRVGANSIQYYRGEAYYCKAYNYGSMNDLLAKVQSISVK